MSFAQWKNEYITGNSKVDEQHRHLFEIINNLHAAMLEGHAQEIIKNTVDQLLKYTIEHFTMEELLMVYHHYPNYADHKKRHTELTTKIKGISAKLTEKNQSINLELLNFLNEWLAHHIKGEDQKLVKFLRDKESEKRLVAHV